jgi:hypothetical protein
LFDFRYHALSLAAVFIALAIGLVLGVTIGDSLVSEADRSLRSTLTGDLGETRQALSESRTGADARDALLERIVPRLVADRLDGRRVAIVGLGGLPSEVEASVREAVEQAGGEIESVTELDRAALDQPTEAGGSRPRAEQAEQRAERLGRALVSGGLLPTSLAGLVSGGPAEDSRRVEGVVVYRERPPLQEDGEGTPPAATPVALDEAVIAGARTAGARVVGAELAGTSRSQVSFFEAAELASVDSVDTPAGALALVLALAGADGSFGLKQSAEELPPLEGLPPRP